MVSSSKANETRSRQRRAPLQPFLRNRQRAYLIRHRSYHKDRHRRPWCRRVGR